MIKLFTGVLPITDIQCAVISSNAKSGTPIYKSETAVFQNDGGRLILSGDVSKDDADEIKAFSKMLGCDLLLSDKKVGAVFGGAVLESGEIAFKKGFGNFNDTGSYADYKFIYSLLSKEFSLPDYNEFSLTLHRAIRQNSVRVYSSENGVCIVSQADDTAVVRAVCVDTAHRSQGEGTALLKSVLSDYSGVYLYKAYGKNDEFYHKLGFEICDEFEIRKLN